LNVKSSHVTNASKKRPRSGSGVDFMKPFRPKFTDKIQFGPIQVYYVLWSYMALIPYVKSWSVDHSIRPKRSFIKSIPGGPDILTLPFLSSSLEFEGRKLNQKSDEPLRLVLNHPYGWGWPPRTNS
jgi:DMSO/TMAO reductase YedYZ molybdopterin-dependent catalytic subunit